MEFLYFLSDVEAADLLKNLTLDSQTKTLEIPEPTKVRTSCSYSNV